MAVTTVLLDLDGVVRHFDPAHTPSVEQRHGLTAGSIHAAAFDPDLLNQAITGRITRARWIQCIGERIGHIEAAHEAFADAGVVDQAMLAETDALRANGVVVALLTNGTDTIPGELAELGLTRTFDAIFNSAELGLAKPDPTVFETVCRRLEASPSEVFFTDDTVKMLTGAAQLGMTAHLFEGVERFRRHLVETHLKTS